MMSYPPPTRRVFYNERSNPREHELAVYEAQRQAALAGAARWPTLPVSLRAPSGKLQHPSRSLPQPELWDESGRAVGYVVCDAYLEAESERIAREAFGMSAAELWSRRDEDPYYGTVAVDRIKGNLRLMGREKP